MSSKHQQPKEYIISEYQVRMIQDEYPFTAREIRSRPHPTPAATHFIIDAGLRADVAETLRMAGCPSLSCRVLDDTMPDYQINAEREKVLDAVIKECETAREENRKIGRATVDQVGKEHWRGRAVGNREIKEYAESLRGGGAP